MKKWFSFEGRVGRAEYFWHSLNSTLMLWLSILIVGMYTVYNADSMSTVLVGSCIVVFIVIMISETSMTIRRLHDLNLSGAHYFLLFIPLVNMYYGVRLTFVKGTEGDNQFGADPLTPEEELERGGIRNYVFTTFTLLIVIVGAIMMINNNEDVAPKAESESGVRKRCEYMHTYPIAADLDDTAKVIGDKLGV